MVLASFSLLDVFWSIIWIFFLVSFLWLLIVILGDLFRSGDLSGSAKALWALALILVPLGGALVYLVVRGAGMGERAITGAGASTPLGSRVVADELEKLASLRDRGVLSDAEFEAQKLRVLT